VVPIKVDSFFGLTESTLIMDAQGTEAAKFEDLHPDDF
jgi:hypothetical protein